MNEEQKKWIKEHFQKMSIEKLRKEFNEKYNTDYKSGCFYYHTQNMGLCKHKQHNYTKEEDAFLKTNSPKMTRQDLCRAFNLRFGTNIKKQAIEQRCFQKGFTAMTDGQFKCGSVPWEKTKGGREEYIKKLKGGNSNSFKKGQIPHNAKPIGSESERIDGVFVKTEKGWKPKQQVVYEKHYGECKKGNRVIFLDGDKNNYAIENLECIDNLTQTFLMSNRWMGKGEITKTGILWVKLFLMQR